ncbi:acyl-CoA thioesterase [Altererythrobacter sp. TH136]|uniref:acyl-CoA thioesterase n=1 Tax=Altererythrobacter sp. TH136 TaxID=2067415 RepID=UPI00116523A3|nr:acyl-CoA thioesterase [Altererythrobacter sp. TH136]QDM41229.1 acyl-CoA thioesterase [Altererythrobacter sp. TH136]
MSNRFAKSFTAAPQHIDELGHVNNAVWLQWVQDIATAHWTAVAAPTDVERYVWVVTRHEIDYRGNVGLGETVSAETWIPAPPRGAQFERSVEFRDAAGKRLVAVRSTWAMLDKASGRLVRVPAAVAAPFLP